MYITCDTLKNTKSITSDSFYFQFKQPSQTIPQKYLATEHITGLPVTIPIKYRINTPSKSIVSAFTLNISVAYAFGYKIRVNNNPYKENYLRFLLVTGIGTDNYMPKDSITNASYKPVSNVIWSNGGGVTYEVGNKFNIGFFLGADRMFGDKKDWYYQNKGWLGFGLGFKFN